MPDVLYSDLDLATQTSSDEMIGLQGGVFKRFAVDELVPFESVLWHGATPAASGATNIAGILAAIATGAKRISFPAGTYDLGTLSASSVLFDLTNKDWITFVAEGAVVLSFTWANNATEPIIFKLAGSQDIRFEGHWKFTDATGYDATGIDGVIAFHFADTCENFKADSLEFSGLRTGIETVGTAHSRSIKNIEAKIKATDCYYVLNNQNNGDDIKAEIHATGCRREYFVYGARNHKIKLTIVDGNAGNASKIASFEGANKTENIDLDITCIWTNAPARNFLDISHAPDSASGVTAGIENVRIHYEVYAGSASVSTSIGAVELTAAVNGGATIATNCNCITDKITITGRTNGYYVYDVYSRYTLTSGNAKGEAFWPVNAKMHVDALKVLHHAKTFAWTPVIGNGWAIGDGSAEGNYTIHNDGDALTVWGKITFGSTSTFAAASIAITLPTLPYVWAGEGSFNTGHPTTLTMVGMANLYDLNATTAYPCPVKISGATGAIYLTLHGLATGGGYVLDTAPFTWADGDTIQFVAHVIHNNTASLAP